MIKSKGFNAPIIPTKVFEVEYKYRPPEDATGEQEVLIQAEQLQVPDLRNCEWEKRWVIVAVWNFLNSEKARELNINQVFIFTKNFNNLIIRLELNEFFDEKPETLNPPSEQAYDKWLFAVKQQFKKLYSLDMDDWLKK